jgi:hypothetical protein
MRVCTEAFMYLFMRVCVYACMHVHACKRARVYVCMRCINVVVYPTHTHNVCVCVCVLVCVCSAK